MYGVPSVWQALPICNDVVKHNSFPQGANSTVTVTEK